MRLIAGGVIDPLDWAPTDMESAVVFQGPWRNGQMGAEERKVRRVITFEGLNGHFNEPGVGSNIHRIRITLEGLEIRDRSSQKTRTIWRLGKIEKEIAENLEFAWKPVKIPGYSYRDQPTDHLHYLKEEWPMTPSEEPQAA